MKLEPVTDIATRDRLLAGDTAPYDAAAGWPHGDSAAGLSFLDTGGLAFVIIDDAGHIAGECGTKTPVRAGGAVEIGYGLAAASRGKRLGTAAVTALVDLLQGDPAVCRIEAEVLESNDPSWRILERLGFEPTGEVNNGFRRYALDVSG